MTEVVLVLDNIRSAQNVGAIFRTADAAGVSKIYLVGYTPAPLDQFKRPNSQLAKAALGAEQTVKWEKVEDIAGSIKKLKQENFKVIALEQAKNSVDYKTIKVEGSFALVVGNEVDGLSAETLAACDIIVEIPMRGKKESLNVSVATGIAVFRLLNI